MARMEGVGGDARSDFFVATTERIFQSPRVPLSIPNFGISLLMLIEAARLLLLLLSVKLEKADWNAEAHLVIIALSL